MKCSHRDFPIQNRTKEIGKINWRRNVEGEREKEEGKGNEDAVGGYIERVKMKRDKGKRVQKCLISFVKMRNEDFREYDAEEDRVCENMFYV